MKGMMDWMFLSRKPNTAHDTSGSETDFGYLDPAATYLDAACQTLRPQRVIDAETEYYLRYNACGGRVKYEWGTTVDAKVREARQSILRYAGKNERDYAVAFTLNTTYGINLVLHQLKAGDYDRIVTSEIEHNSVMLPSMTWAARHGKQRLVLPRDAGGNLLYKTTDLEKGVVVLNSMSNIDGRRAGNLPQLAADTHAAGGILLVDGAQGFGHDIGTLRDTDFDAAFGSGHKMYGPSLGFIIIRRTLLRQLEPFFLGGGTVADVTRDSFDLLGGEEEHSILEAGLQNWGGILGLGTAVEWLLSQDDRRGEEKGLSQVLFDGLKNQPRVTLLNAAPGPIVSFHVDGIDGHQLALYLARKNIMCRSGHFCCHGYLQHQLHLPPLLRVSLGLYNTKEHVDAFLHTLATILTTL